MIMMNLLVPIDFSDCSVKALEFAIILNKIAKGKLIILHAVQVPILAGDDSNAGGEIKADVSEKMDALLNQVTDLKELNYDFELSFEHMTTSIRKLDKSTSIDLIVMGTKGATGAKEIFLGSNTYDIIKEIKCPVLAIPEKAVDFQLSSIAFASDYKKIEKFHDLDTMLKLAKIRNSEIHVLHVGEDNKIGRDEIEVGRGQDQYFKDTKHSYHFINGSDVANEINRYIQSNNIKILALYARKHDLTDKLFHHSLTKEMTYHAEIPLLVLPESDD